MRPGDRWCLCVARWREAFEAGVAPPVSLAATHEKALAVVTLEQLTRHALDRAMNSRPPLRAVIDTNVLLDFWVFDDARAAPLRVAVETRCHRKPAQRRLRR